MYFLISRLFKVFLSRRSGSQFSLRFIVSIPGKSTGIVTNTRITHATPAALYGHSPSRYWEDDSKVPPVARKSCKDLARQLIENDPGRNINVSTQWWTANFTLLSLLLGEFSKVLFAIVLRTSLLLTL